MNIWDIEMSADDIVDISTDSMGNVINRRSIMVHGNMPTTDLNVTEVKAFGTSVSSGSPWFEN